MTSQDLAVNKTMEHLGLVDLTTALEGQPSHFPNQPGAPPSRIEGHGRTLPHYDPPPPNPLWPSAVATDRD